MSWSRSQLSLSLSITAIVSMNRYACPVNLGRKSYVIRQNIRCRISSRTNLRTSIDRRQNWHLGLVKMIKGESVNTICLCSFSVSVMSNIGQTVIKTGASLARYENHVPTMWLVAVAVDDDLIFI